MAMLEVKDLEVYYGMIQAIKGISFEVNQGEVIALIGANGAGKTTTLQTITGMLQAKKGHILFEGQDITHMPVNERAKLGIFMAFQNPIAVKGISVENFIRNAKSTITGETQRIMPFRKKLRAQMEELRMDKSYAERYVNDGFSGGERKKTEILQMTLLEPKLTMLDEIDSGLDVDAVRVVSDRVAAYHNGENAVLVITHHSEILQSLKPDPCSH